MNFVATPPLFALLGCSRLTSRQGDKIRQANGTCDDLHCVFVLVLPLMSLTFFVVSAAVSCSILASEQAFWLFRVYATFHGETALCNSR